MLKCKNTDDFREMKIKWLLTRSPGKEGIEVRVEIGAYGVLMGDA